MRVIGVWGEQGIFFSPGIEPGAGIGVISGFLRETRFNRIALDVPTALKVVTFLTDSRASESLLEDMSDKDACFLEVAGVSQLDPMHQGRQVAAFLDFKKQVEMVRHEAVVKELGREPGEALFQMVEETEVIFRLREQLPAVIPAIEDVVDATIHQFSRFSRQYRPASSKGNHIVKSENFKSNIFRTLHTRKWYPNTDRNPMKGLFYLAY